MAKITLPPGKTTWVPFTDQEVDFEVERKLELRYSKYSVLNESSPEVQMRYNFSGLEGKLAMPSSQLVLKVGGIPLAILSSEPTTDTTRFCTEWIGDVFLVVNDRVSGRKKIEEKEKKLSKYLIERTWTEKVTRTLTVKNETGKTCHLLIEAYDNPSDLLLMKHQDPEPTSSQPPQYRWELDFEKDEEKRVEYQFDLAMREQMELPRENEDK